MIGILFFVAWIGFQAWNTNQAIGGAGRKVPKGMPRLDDIVQTDVIHSIVFGGFAFLSMMSMVMLGSSLTLLFKTPDVDVLFPTPISPKKLMIFKMVRDTLVGTLVPLIMLMFFAWKSTGNLVEAWQRGASKPDAIYLSYKLGILAWLLMSFFWTCVGYWATLTLARGDEQSDRRRSLVNWCVGGVVLASIAYLGLKVRMEGFASLKMTWADPILSIIYLPATAAAHLTTMPITGQWGLGLVGGAGLIIGSVFAFQMAQKNAGWLYEITALNAAVMEQKTNLAKGQNMVANVAAQAQKGKFKAKKTWINKLEFKGAQTLIWKELLIMYRSSKIIFLLFMPIMGMVGFTFASLTGVTSRSGERVDDFLPLIFGIMTFALTTITTQTGFLQMLKLGDLQKPLPFTPGKVVFYEVVSKVVPVAVCLLVGCVAGLFGNLGAWQGLLAAFIGATGFSLLLSAAYAVMFLMLPDYDDPTQRSFRGLISLLGVALFSAPSILILALFLGLLKTSILVAILPVTLINIMLAIIATAIAGKFYASFNPSE